MGGCRGIKDHVLVIVDGGAELEEARTPYAVQRREQSPTHLHRSISLAIDTSTSDIPFYPDIRITDLSGYHILP